MTQTLANRNNNPGNLRDPSTGTFRQFSTPQEGYAALLNDLNAKKTGASKTGLGPQHTLVDFAKVYAPAGDKNDPAQYAANIANKMGVRPDTLIGDLDVGKWAEAVANSEGYIGGTSAGDSTQQKTLQPDQNTQPEQPKGVLGTDPNASTTDKILNNSVTRGIQKFFPGAKVGAAIGTLGGLIKAKGKDILTGSHEAENYDTSAPSPLQVGADVAQGALTVAAGLPEEGAATTAGKGLLGNAKGIQMAKSGIGRIAQNVGLGAGFGASGSVAGGETDLGKIAKDTAAGGAAGGVLGAAGEILNKAASSLPKRFLRSNVTKINNETADYAVSKGLGSPSKMLRESEKSIKDIGTQLGQTLESPKYKDVSIGTQDIVDSVIKQYPDAELTPEVVLQEVKKLAKLKGALVTKLANGEQLTLKQAHSLNSELGGNVFKTVFDDPTTKAGKDIGAAVYHAISNKIKTVAPETVPMFETLSKEYPLRKALNEMTNRVGKHKAFNLRDLMAIIAGGSAAGPLGAAGAFLGEKLITSPGANLVAGGLIHNLGKSTGAIKPLLLRNTVGK